MNLLRRISEPRALVLACLMADVLAHSAAGSLLDHRLVA